MTREQLIEIVIDRQHKAAHSAKVARYFRDTGKPIEYTYAAHIARRDAAYAQSALFTLLRGWK